jgi:hypothetical protein
MQLAQLNIAHLSAPIDSPALTDFVTNLDQINALAETSPGFVWRLQTEEGNATSISFYGDDIIVNLSMWTDMESLHGYVYRSAHNKIMSRRKEWFQRMTQAYQVLWWVPEGHRPSVEEANLKLQLLNDNGPTAEAFTFKHSFPAP